jgi:hypothetical protein
MTMWLYYVFFLFFIDRAVFAYNEYIKIVELQLNDIVSSASCRKLNYRNIASEHVEMCNSIDLRINTHIMARVITNTINDFFEKPITIHTVVKTICAAMVVLVIYSTQSFYARLNIQGNVLPYNYKRIKND